MSHFIENQKWRYATKKFDASKKVSAADLETLKEAIQLSTSSYGLQLYKVFIIENPEVRAKLQPVSWGQSQIVDASHLFGSVREFIFRRDTERTVAIKIIAKPLFIQEQTEWTNTTMANPTASFTISLSSR